jgi:formylglycine-generating enzyme required for sulfatase activity
VAALAGVVALWFMQGSQFSGRPLPSMSVNALPRDPARPMTAMLDDDLEDPTAGALREGGGRARPEMASIAGGLFWMGSDAGADGEHPRHQIRLGSYWLDVQEVSNRQFAEFAKATGYVTTAERDGIGNVFDPTSKRWQRQSNANWRRPDGIAPFLPDAPVTQVTWDDATAYARWAGKRLPTEAEWEYAARGGLVDCDYAWGRDLLPQGRFLANFWQGWFPDADLGLDGFSGIAPVRSYPANRYDLFDLVGNVWEWCGDWHSADYYEVSAHDNPSGPVVGARRVIRGGSWLSAENSGRGLWVYGRDGVAPNQCRQDVGFRCARDVERNRP